VQTQSSKSPTTTTPGGTQKAKASPKPQPNTASSASSANTQTWDHFAQAIGQAMGELTAMVELINRIRETKHLTLEPFTRIRLPDKTIINEITVSSSQKQSVCFILELSSVCVADFFFSLWPAIASSCLHTRCCCR